MLTPKLIAEILSIPVSLAARQTTGMDEAMALAEINTPMRAAHWVAQIGHETMRLRFLRELWGPTAAQALYERDFAAPWPRNSADVKRCRRNRIAYRLGNVRVGDGKRYMGRGHLQTTGLGNYILLTAFLRERLGGSAPDLVTAPALLEKPQIGLMGAAYYWHSRDLNRFADVNNGEELRRRVNGGANGLGETLSLTTRGYYILTGASDDH